MKILTMTVRTIGDEEIIKVFESYDEITGLYDYTEEIVVSEKTWEKLKKEDYYPKRYGNTVRAFIK